MAYTYRIINSANQDCIQRIEDGAWIPKDLENGDYREYLHWVKLGNAAKITAIVDPIPANNDVQTQIYAIMKSIADLNSKIDGLTLVHISTEK